MNLCARKDTLSTVFIKLALYLLQLVEDTAFWWVQADLTVVVLVLLIERNLPLNKIVEIQKLRRKGIVSLG